jgi:hypothetical protein
MIVILLSATTVAADAKRYIGAFCTFADDDNSGQDRSFPKFSNTSGSTRAVICPIVQDIVDGDIEYAAITAEATMDEDTCLLWERVSDGSTQTWTHDGVISEGGGMNTTTWFGGSSWQNASTEATFAIECDLPTGNAVLFYRFDDR